ncbi:type III PLP-dependent enzyme domain-containing protein [Nocardia goodfellowii]|uniref:Diaminopimelate decarboxylase n=1 Tax=Nocardia goodfellowii TaxID=882446 RepID=A0ABS4QKR8_9NOCA|nr:decarboxylase [Nocardia goodfellowii]MBP2192300.1 diaminopimelate decarboxylase [Nocardia goodfellowii]
MSGPPALPAKIHPLVRAFLDTRDALDETLGRFGTPVHLVFPQVYAENLQRLRSVLDRQLPRHRICYAHKVNRSRAFVRTAEHAGAAVDVASPQELASAVGAGFGTMRIEATGPKDEVFLRDLIDCGATINVDNLWELRRITELAGDGARVPVLLRVSGFPGTPVSRFGVPLPHLDRAFHLLTAHRSRITLLGFAFHIDSGEIAERIRAIDACLALIEQAYGHGLTPSVLDIGGGFRQVFTADVHAFDGYVQALRAALLGRGEPMTWAGNTFGYHLADGAIHGTPVFHKYANTVAAHDMLADVLSAPLERHGGRTVAQVAADNMLDLWIEPGKALVDHAGVTVARVVFVKDLAEGTVLVNVDLSRDSVTPADQEVMVDPVLIPAGAPERGSASSPAAAPPGGATVAPLHSAPLLNRDAETGYVGVYFAGRLCLERDMITNHKVWLQERPRPGDLVIFPNTAAYHSDLSAAPASMHPLPAKLAVIQRAGGFQICRDLDYEPHRSSPPASLPAVPGSRIPLRVPPPPSGRQTPRRPTGAP